MITNEEMTLLEEAKNKNDWRILSTAKLRYFFQRYFINPSNPKFMEIAKFASHQLGHHHFCDKDCLNVIKPNGESVAISSLRSDLPF